MTIKNLYPKQRPIGLLNFTSGFQEAPVTSTLTRATVGTYIGPDGLLNTAQIDEPRFDYFQGGLLLESAVENQSYNSNDWTGRSSAGYGVNPTITKNAGISPDGTNNASLITTVNTDQDNRLLTSVNVPTASYVICYSVFVKRGNTPEIVFLIGGGAVFNGFITFNFDTETLTSNDTATSWLDNGGFIKLANGWYRIWGQAQSWTTGSAGIGSAMGQTAGKTWYQYGEQIEEGSRDPAFKPSSYFETTGSRASRAEDVFTVNSVNNLDPGFSLLIDSETLTEDYLYKILKADDTEVASLNVDNGVLEWKVGGVSNQTQGTYPQVGFQTGRVTTLSSIGAAYGDTEQNVLYTTGLSFPTDAVVPDSAAKIVFGTPQTLRAGYLWSGQLDPIEAVSVINGKYNLVNPAGTQADALIFAVNTDVDNTGKVDLALNRIVPVVSQTTYWGDGTTSTADKDVTPSHDYPYPGVYKVQTVAAAAPSGADNDWGIIDLHSMGQNAVREVVQWPKGYKATDTGIGFTGSQMTNILENQYFNTKIPPFKYSNITDLTYAFYSSSKDAANGWDWVPVNLPMCESLNGTFTYACTGATEAEKSTFPQLQTSSALKRLDITFRGMPLTSFPTSGLPFSDTSGVENWSGTFGNMANLKSLGSLDTSSATNMSAILRGSYRFDGMPSLDYSDVTNLYYAFYQCVAMTSFPQPSSGNQTSKVKDIRYAWGQCSSMSSFPTLDLSSVETAGYAWTETTALENFPAIDFSSVTDNFNRTWYASGIKAVPSGTIWPSGDFGFSGAFYACNNLTTMPNLPASVTQRITELSAAWRSCGNLTSFPEWDTSNVTSISQAWYGCSIDDAGMPKTLNTSKCKGFDYTWLSNTFTTFPYAGWMPADGSYSFENATSFRQTWWGCSSLTDFAESMFDNTGVLDASAFNSAWGRSCKLTAQSCQNILLSCVTNGSTESLLDLSSDPTFGGSNAKYEDWSQKAKDAEEVLSAPVGTKVTNGTYTNVDGRGWTVVFRGTKTRKTFGSVVCKSGDRVQFFTLSPDSDFNSGMTDVEEFADENTAALRAFELDYDFREFEFEETYEEGEYVKVGKRLYKSLQINDTALIPARGQTSDFEVRQGITPAFSPNWQLISSLNFNQLNEEESDGGPVQRSA